MSFIDDRLVRSLGIELQPLDSPLIAKALNNMTLARIEFKTVPVTLILSGNHREEICFHVISCPLTPLVLGYPWLKSHNPHINWVTGSVTAWSVDCHSNCLHAALTSNPTSALVFPPEPPDLSAVPEVYHNLATVFSKHHALSLPPHDPMIWLLTSYPELPSPAVGCLISPGPNGRLWRDISESPLLLGLSAPLRLQWGRGFSLWVRRMVR